MTTMRAIVGLGLLSFACGVQEQRVFAESAVQSETSEAVMAWNDKLIHSCPEVALTMVADSSDADIVVFLGPMGAGEKHLAGSELDGRIRIDPEDVEAYPDTVAAVVGHELGHALGLGHSENPEDLMHAPVAEHRSPEPTIADVHAVCEAWGEGPTRDN